MCRSDFKSKIKDYKYLNDATSKLNLTQVFYTFVLKAKKKVAFGFKKPIQKVADKF